MSSLRAGAHQQENAHLGWLSKLGQGDSELIGVAQSGTDPS